MVVESSVLFKHNLNTSVVFDAYASLETSMDIYGGFGMRLRIAQPGWLTTGLGFFYEDPMFLEGIWEYGLVESESPMGSSFAREASLAENALRVTLVQDI